MSPQTTPETPSIASIIGMPLLDLCRNIAGEPVMQPTVDDMLAWLHQQPGWHPIWLHAAMDGPHPRFLVDLVYDGRPTIKTEGLSLYEALSKAVCEWAAVRSVVSHTPRKAPE